MYLNETNFDTCMLKLQKTGKVLGINLPYESDKENNPLPQKTPGSPCVPGKHIPAGKGYTAAKILRTTQYKYR